MTNEDLKRFYQDNQKITEPLDFVRLDKHGKIPASVLPSYVDDVIEGYYYDSKFYEDAAHTKLITGEKSKIYLDLSTNSTYRWSGTLYVLIGDGNLKLYQHNLMFTVDVEDASALMYYFSIISHSSVQLTKSTLISTLFDLYGQNSFTGATRNTGSSTYSNPIGLFSANCGSTGDNLNVCTPSFSETTITIDGTDYTLQTMTANSFSVDGSLVSFDILTDTVVEL